MSGKCRAEPPAPPPPPPASPGAPVTDLTQLLGVNNSVNESGFVLGLGINVIIGSVIMVTFMLIHRRFSMYHIRLFLPQVSVRPPPLLKAGASAFASFFFFWWNVIATSDLDLLGTAGMDALILTKVAALGVKLFVPITFFGLAVLWPVNRSQGNADPDQPGDIQITPFMRNTIANVKDPAIIWVHCVLLFFYNLYAIMLLHYHYAWYVKVRQHYMVSGNDVNYWQERLRKETQAVPELNNLMENLRQLKELAASRELGEEEEGEEGVPVASKEAVAVDTRDQEADLVAPRHSAHLGQSSLFTHASLPGLASDTAARPATHTAPAAPYYHQAPAAMRGAAPGGRPLGEAQELPVELVGKVKQSKKPEDQFMGRDETLQRKAESNWGRWWEDGVVYEHETDSTDENGELTLVARKPSVRQRTTVNTVTKSGKRVSVNASQYTVLVTDVEQPPYNLGPDWHSQHKKKPKRRSTSSWRSSLPSWLRDLLREWVLLDDPENDPLLQQLRLEDAPAFNTMRRSKSIHQKALDARTAADGDASGSSDVGQDGNGFLDDVVPLEGGAEQGATGRVHFDQHGKLNGPASGSKAAGKPKGWTVIRDAIKSGRFFEMPQDIVTTTFSQLFPDEFDGAIPVINHLEVDNVLLKWDQEMAKLEMALAKKEKTGREPVHQVGGLPCAGCCCCCAGCALCGTQVASIPYHQHRVLELEKEVVAAQREAVTRKFTPSWFVFFKSQKAATIASSTILHPENNQVFQVHQAPGPENVNWQVLWMNRGQRAWRKVWSKVLFACIICFPISAFTSGLSVMNFFICEEITDANRAYCKPQEDSPVVFFKRIITGWLPGILLAVYQQMIVPRLAYLCAQLECSTHSLSGVDQRIMGIYYVWDVANVFLQSLLGTTIITQVQRVLDCPNDTFNIIIEVLGTTLPNASIFFFNYIWLRAVVLVPYRLLIPHPGIICYAVRGCGKLGVMSKRQLVEAFAPRSIRYGIEFGLMLLMFLIGLCYSVVSPLLAPVVLLYFMVIYLFWRYTVLYVYVRKYESGGTMWPMFFNRTLVSLSIFSFFTSMVFLFKRAFAPGLLSLIVIPFILKRFHTYCFRKYELGVSTTPLELAFKAPFASVPPSTYVPPPLRNSLAGWHPEWHKAWEGMGALSYLEVR